MRHRYQITITDYRGARHFTLSQLMRRALAGGLATLALVFFGGFMIIHVLTGKVGSLNEQVGSLKAEQGRIASENAALVAERIELHEQIERKARALMAVSDELDQIEMLIGLQPEPEQPLVQRLDTASQTAFEKRLMLQTIPSGYPLETQIVTSDFGMRQHPIKKRSAMHGGVDLRASRGTPLYATASGVVEWASEHKNSGLGNMVKLVHNYGFSTIYGHLDQIEVNVGNYVERGDLIGYSGNTGVSEAPHLHYEVRYLQRRLDPAPFLKWSLEDYDVLFTKEDRVQWESLAKVIRRTASVPERPSLQQAQSWSATLP